MKKSEVTVQIGSMAHASCWAAVVAKDHAANGKFVYSASSTGIYCRPSCPSKLAKRENVAFHPNAEAAEMAGYRRACRRCRRHLIDYVFLPKRRWRFQWPTRR